MESPTAKIISKYSSKRKDHIIVSENVRTQTWRVGVSGKYSRLLNKWLGVRSSALANGANSQASCLPPT